MTVSIIKEVFVKDIRRDDDLKLALAKANGVKVSSIERWLRDEDPMLTTVANLSMLKAHFGLNDIHDLLEKRKSKRSDLAAK